MLGGLGHKSIICVRYGINVIDTGDF